MKKSLLIAFIFLAIQSFAQVGINTNMPHASSILDVTSTTKGFLFPRMTQSQRNAIVSPTAGLLVWCLNCGTNGELQVFDGVEWATAMGVAASVPPAVAPTNLAYVGSPYSYYLQILIAPIAAPSNYGGTVTNYTISPALPSGLVLNATTGEITGTPSVLSAATDYTVTAANVHGNTTTTINIAVVNAPPPSGLNYSSSSYAFNYQTAITPVAQPTNNGGAVSSYSISPSLPTGLIFNTTTGAITGTPTVVSPATNYTITATNPSGSTTKTISITVNNIAPTNLQYTGSPFAYFVPITITPISAPTNSGGIVTTYSIAPALPSGLVLNTTTGAITGTPTVAAPATNYTVTGSNVAGSTTATINITVSQVLDLTGINNTTVNVAFSLRKLSSSYTGSAIRVRRSSDNAEQNIGFDGSGNLDQAALATFVGSANGFVTTWYDQSGKGKHVVQTTNSNQPKIVSDGSIITRNGKPMIHFESETFARLMNTSTTTTIPVSMVNVAGVDRVSNSEFNIASFGGSNGLCLRIQNGQYIGIKIGSALVFTDSYTTAGQLNIFSVAQTSSTGDMFLNGTQATITAGGANSVANPSSNITIGSPGDFGANSNDGFLSESIFYSSLLSTTDRQALEANQAAYYGLIPAFNYANTSVATYGSSVTISPTGLANVGTFTISPSLPSGLSINANTGIITGTPTVVSNATTYTVSSTTGLGVGTASFSLTVNDIAPALTYANTNLVINNPATVTPNITSGMVAATYSITPSLPTGLSLDTSTGTISGTPTVAIPITTFTITATNSGGVGAATLKLYVGTYENPTNLVYSGTPYVFPVGNTIVPVDAPTNDGSVPTSYSIDPVLPNGLTFNTATGVITGYPTVVTSAADYTVTATNSYGNTTVLINITVSDAPPINLQFSGSSFTYYMNNAYSITSPTFNGGTPTLYAISPSLPSGLILNTSTGAISGTPNVISTATNYTITASNSQGNATSVISIEIYPVLDLASLNVSTTASAYSLRKLSSTFTGAAVRVRRSSDNTEQNIGFNGSGDLDQVSLLSFVGSGDGFVTVWYDQSKNANNMIQTNTLYQPRIVNAGVVETVNSKPTVYFDTKFMAANLVAANYPSTINGVATSKTATATGLFFAIGSNNGPGVGVGNYVSVISTDYNLTGIKGGVAYMPTPTAITPNSAAVITLNTLAGGDASTISLNGSALTISDGATSIPFTPTLGIVIGSNTPIEAPNVMLSNGYVQEAIFIGASLTTPQKQALENNQGAYYGVIIN